MDATILTGVPFLDNYYNETYCYLVPRDPKSAYVVWEVGASAREELTMTWAPWLCSAEDGAPGAGIAPGSGRSDSPRRNHSSIRRPAGDRDGGGSGPDTVSGSVLEPLRLARATPGRVSSSQKEIQGSPRPSSRRSGAGRRLAALKRPTMRPAWSFVYDHSP